MNNSVERERYAQDGVTVYNTQVHTYLIDKGGRAFL